MTFLVSVIGVRGFAIAQNGITLGDVAALAAIAWVFKDLLLWQADLGERAGRSEVATSPSELATTDTKTAPR